MTLRFICGAPGAGKSATADILRSSQDDFLVFDIDWLAEPAGELAGRSLYTDPTTWKPYNALWLQVLGMTIANGARPLFFCPNSPADYADAVLPSGCSKIHWLLLDCDEDTRRERLQRRDWAPAQIDEALEDADELRTMVETAIDTSNTTPSEVASMVIEWASTPLEEN